MSEGKPTKEELTTRAKAALAQLFGKVYEKDMLGERRAAGEDGLRGVTYYLIAPPRWGVGELSPQDCALKMAAVMQKLLGGDIPVTTASPPSRPGQVGVGSEDTVFVAIDKARLLKHPAAIQDLQDTTLDKLQMEAEKISIDAARERLATAQRQRLGLDAAGKPISTRGDQAKTSRRWAVDREPSSNPTGSRGR